MDAAGLAGVAASDYLFSYGVGGWAGVSAFALASALAYSAAAASLAFWAASSASFSKYKH